MCTPVWSPVYPGFWWFSFRFEGVGGLQRWGFGKSTSFLNVSGNVDVVRKKQNKKILSFKKVTTILPFENFLMSEICDKV